METDLDKSEDKVRLYTIQKEEGEQSKSTAESLARKIQLLEEELDTAEKNVKETTEKYVLLACLLQLACCGCVCVVDVVCADCLPLSRLRQVDVKAEHFERQVQRIEQERDAWEKKFEVRIYFVSTPTRRTLFPR